ncbi:MAG: tetratricopeptide repeat protein [Acidobacteria bacterium]|nr:tetratricopeptide repeat protein [Acidobacteriota bacterium]
MFATLFLSCLFVFPTAPQTSYVIQGRIVDERNNPVKDMRVTLMTDTFSILGNVNTDVTGRYQFRSVLRGTYVVQVEAGGTDFELQQRRIDLASLGDRPGREVVTQDFVLRHVKGKASAPGATEAVFAQNVPATAQAEYRKAVEAVNVGKSDEALEALNRALAIFPDYFQALETLGTLQVSRNQFEAAAQTLSHAIEVNPKAGLSYYSLGMAQINLKKMPEAIEALRKSIIHNPSMPNAHLMLGFSLISNRQFAEAEPPLKQAYQLGGAKMIDAQQYLAVIYDKLGRYKEAAAALEIYVKDLPKDRASDKEKFKQLAERLKKKADVEKK